MRIVRPAGSAGLDARLRLMTYLGANFVLNAGMHSYGMGDSPVVKWMVITALVELVDLVVAGVAWRDRQRLLAES